MQCIIWLSTRLITLPGRRAHPLEHEHLTQDPRHSSGTDPAVDLGHGGALAHDDLLQRCVSHRLAPRGVSMGYKTARLIDSLSIWADPSHINIPTQPG